VKKNTEKVYLFWMLVVMYFVKIDEGNIETMSNAETNTMSTATLQYPLDKQRPHMVLAERTLYLFLRSLG
jgi:hypothetical protein